MLVCKDEEQLHVVVPVKSNRAQASAVQILDEVGVTKALVLGRCVELCSVVVQSVQAINRLILVDVVVTEGFYRGRVVGTFRDVATSARAIVTVRFLEVREQVFRSGVDAVDATRLIFLRT